ncbi:MAG TPA: BON domain-containing protein [Gemmatimonadaceae bacterium]|nr:BON domain-containing protein [Gemmatimonadaceae bacterium]
MARDFEDIHDLDDLDDGELRDLVRERLADNGGVDTDNVTVRVEDGVVHLLGRVGTEEELRVAEHVLTDVIGLQRYENELVVDALRRTEEEAGADDAAGGRDEGDYILGDAPRPLSPEADHRVEDLEAELYGTHDLQDAIERGESYSPPDRATPEGLSGTQRGPEVYGEDH